MIRVLRQVQGVADAMPLGDYLKAIHVEADPGKLYAAGLSLAAHFSLMPYPKAISTSAVDSCVTAIRSSPSAASLILSRSKTSSRLL